MNPELFSHLEAQGIVSPTEVPRLAGTIEHNVRMGRLVNVMGGNYAAREQADSFEIRVAALRATYPNCVLARETAAKLSWWPELTPELVQFCHRQRVPERRGFAAERRTIEKDLIVWDGTHFLTNPALTVLDLTDTLGGTAIDESLRRGAVTLEDLRHALLLTRGRRGNRQRAQLVRESRAEPWSELEREAHVRLRKAHFPGWVANHHVRVGERDYYLDLAVPDLKLAAEIDGWQHHREFRSFVSDRARWNALTLAGWTLLVFTASTIDQLVGQMQAAVALINSR